MKILLNINNIYSNNFKVTKSDKKLQKLPLALINNIEPKTQCQDEFRNLSGCVLKILTAGSSALREWVLDSREVKSEEKMSFTLFEKCK